jgi:hypothetical protein
MDKWMNPIDEEVRERLREWEKTLKATSDNKNPLLHCGIESKSNFSIKLYDSICKNIKTAKKEKFEDITYTRWEKINVVINHDLNQSSPVKKSRSDCCRTLIKTKEMRKFAIFIPVIWLQTIHILSTLIVCFNQSFGTFDNIWLKERERERERTYFQLRDIQHSLMLDWDWTQYYLQVVVQRIEAENWKREDTSSVELHVHSSKPQSLVFDLQFLTCVFLKQTKLNQSLLTSWKGTQTTDSFIYRELSQRMPVQLFCVKLRWSWITFDALTIITSYVKPVIGTK